MAAPDAAHSTQRSALSRPSRPLSVIPHPRALTRIEALLAVAGVAIDGTAATDMHVHDARLYSRVLAHGSLGLGEAYMDGWWDCDDLDGLLFKLIDARLDQQVGGVEDAWLFIKARLINLQRGRRAYVIGERHYDLGNDLFEAMLGQRLVYSCGYWKDAADLDQAQEAKLDLVSRKLCLQPGMRILDIGCGWGEALKFAAERYGVSGVGVTVSHEQAA
ncbi:MAG: class I SAM-dependent methyltransferase, partial [Dokdonella sp.]